VRCAACGAAVLAAGDHLTHGELDLDVDARELARRGRVIPLTPKECELAELFLRHPGQVLRSAQIYEAVWGYDISDSSNALQVMISALRRKTEAMGEPRVFHTIRHVGYVLRAPDLGVPRTHMLAGAEIQRRRAQLRPEFERRHR
jgi:DNA-binding response OmpR family regulator